MSFKLQTLKNNIFETNFIALEFVIMLICLILD